MKNPYMPQVLSIKEEVKKHLPYGLETTADLLLEFMSKSKKFFNWVILRLPAKEEMKKFGLIIY